MCFLKLAQQMTLDDKFATSFSPPSYDLRCWDDNFLHAQRLHGEWWWCGSWPVLFRWCLKQVRVKHSPLNPRDERFGFCMFCGYKKRFVRSLYFVSISEECSNRWNHGFILLREVSRPLCWGFCWGQMTIKSYTQSEQLKQSSFRHWIWAQNVGKEQDYHRGCTPKNQHFPLKKVRRKVVFQPSIFQGRAVSFKEGKPLSVADFRDWSVKILLPDDLTNLSCWH